MKITSLPTPALILDKAAFESNRAAMTALLKDSTLALRPHFKSHKCAAIAKMQMEDGAKGMTCAKLSEAEDLALSGIEDILIANQITDPQKISRLSHLAGCCHLTVCVDCEENIVALSRACATAGTTLYCLVEYEIGMERCGVETKEEVVRLAKIIDKAPNLVFAGVQAYAGHISHEPSLQARAALTEKNAEAIRALLAALQEEGVPAAILSGGSTGTSEIKAKEGLYTELQAGSYLFMDATYRDLALPFQNALFILTTVVSANEHMIVVDAGVKSCGVDQGMPVPLGFTVEKTVASEEHFQLHNPSKRYKVGDKLLLIPAHCCSTVNLHTEIFLADGEKVADRIPVTSRGGFR